ncbi:MAG TPA: pyruvate kinase [Acidimicrobiales bacterium]|nr:pyruvate kinase [Acidimicrobiales bacterium]
MTTEQFPTARTPGRRAKIVCTLGPATSTAEQVEAMVRAGMDVARLNLSHGTHEEHRQLCAHIRKAADAVGRVVGVLADLQGPRIRLGVFEGGVAHLVTGDRFILTTEPVVGSAERASMDYALLAHEVGIGDEILANDGRVRLEVLGSNGSDIRCLVVQGGFVGDRKGLNLPGVDISAPALTAKDADDLRFMLDIGVDLVALSFVRRPSDVELPRAIMDDVGRRVPVIAKLETPQAVAALDEVVAAFDGLMVARGDLGVELPLEQVPLVQKRAIQVCREYAKPVIVATQMLESMIAADRPTRAEVSDVANAVLDGADAMMLSGETAVGCWPIETVKTMALVIAATEQGRADVHPSLELRLTGREEAISLASVVLAFTTDAAALVAFTETGTTARRVSAHRPALPLLVFTPHRTVQRQLTLVWGVESFVAPRVATTDELIEAVDRSIRDLDRAVSGDVVVVVAGTPPGRPGNTNSIRVHSVT